MIKRIILCSSAFLIFAFLATGFADEHFPFLAQVSKASVNVRSGPNTNFEKVAQLNKGDQVVVLGRNFEWLKIQPMPSTQAYIRMDYLQSQNGSNNAQVIGDNVNVRCRPRSDAASLGEVKKGTMVRILGQSQGWALLAPVAGTVVWIHQDFLEKVSDDVPDALLIPAMPMEAQTLPMVPAAASQVPVSPWVTMRGTVEALVQPLGQDVHYEIVMDDKSVFILQDIPHIDYFCNTVVNLEGAVVPDPQKKFMYPLLHINKISLVL